MSEPVSTTAPPLRPPVLMNQHWRDLTFLHWAVEPSRVAPLMPPGVRPDVHDDGATYVGLVPFRMVDAGLGRRSSVPWLGTFLETNVRLYSVDAAGRRGVVFLSLDAERLLVVAAARAGVRVPYRWARMSYARAGDVHTYRSRLALPHVPGHPRRPVTAVAVRVGATRTATALDAFVSARWRLHTRYPGRTALVPNAHEEWPLHDVDLLGLEGGLLVETGFGDLLDREPDQLAFSPGVRAEFGLPRWV